MTMTVEQLEARCKALRDALESMVILGVCTVYTHDGDTLGCYSCCGESTYQPHASDCPAEQARALLAEIKSEE